MTIPAQLSIDVKAWLNFDYSDALIESWVRLAFERISETLRCAHMVEVVTAEVDQDRVLLPVDWLESDFVRYVDGYPIYYRTRDDFYNANMENDGYFTIIGRYLIVGGDPTDADPKDIELSYFQKLPTTFDDTHFMFTAYYSLTLFSTLSVAAAYAEDNENGPKWIQAVADYIQSANDTYLMGKASGSRLRRPRRHGFG